MEVVAVISAPGGQGHSHGRCGAAELQSSRSCGRKKLPAEDSRSRIRSIAERCRKQLLR